MDHKTIVAREMKTAQKIRVLLVEDHPITANGLSLDLRGRGQIEIVGTAMDGIDAIQKAKTLLPDVILLDLSLPRMSGLKALAILRNEVPASRVLIFTMHDSKEYLRESLRLGASGYILKSASPDVLTKAIRSVYFGKLAIDVQMLKSLRLLKKSLSMGSVLLETGSLALTSKEKEILQLIVKGCTPQEIAGILKLRYYTVTTHLKHIYKKLGVSHRGAAIAKAIGEHLFEP